ncbi:MAG: M28 family peptidase [Armatimonadetes bacterium]|nr:M28 family peptidase [Armatimonadota bacterium]
MAGGGKGAAPYDQVSAKRLMADVEALARWVRLSGTPEEMESFDCVRRRLRAAGCSTRLILHDSLVSLPGEASLVIIPDRGPRASMACVTHSFAAGTGPGGVEALAVYASSGRSAELAAARVAGRIALIDGLATPDRVHAAERAGAAGLIFLNRDPLVHEMIVSPVWGSPTPEGARKLPCVPVVSVAQTEGDILRKAVVAGEMRARITAEVDTRWRKIPLLTADLPGEVEDTFVLLAGHLDSWHRGAMDNGTANATMIEVARVLAAVRRYRGVRLAFWSGHSHGRYSGSTWYADHHWQELDERCVVHVNVDSVGGRGAVINPHAYAMPETSRVADRVISEVTGGRFQGGRVGRAGDQSFLGVGIPSLLMSLSEQPAGSANASEDFNIRTGGVTGGLGWWWHTTEDLPDKIAPDALDRDCRIYLGIVHAFCTEPVLPLDYQATARAWLKKLRSLRQGAGRRVDLRPAIAEAQRLVEATEALGRLASALRASPRKPAVRALNNCLMALGRVLIPVDYTRNGRFDHDAALEQHDTPLLDAVRALAAAAPEEACQLEVRAVRDLNAVRFALSLAAEVAEATAREARAGIRRR